MLGYFSLHDLLWYNKFDAEQEFPSELTDLYLKRGSYLHALTNRGWKPTPRERVLVGSPTAISKSALTSMVFQDPARLYTGQRTIRVARRPRSTNSCAEEGHTCRTIMMFSWSWVQRTTPTECNNQKQRLDHLQDVLTRAGPSRYTWTGSR